VPLSDHERKLLAEMEAALEQDDPRLVSTLNGKIRSPQGSRVLFGVVGLFGGMAILLAGLIAKIPAVGIAGFVISLIGAFFIISNFSAGFMKGMATTQSAPKKKSWGSRLEERWDRRNYEN
jgi:hypothetical protein